MNTLNPQVIEAVSVAVAAAAMLVLGRKAQLLEQRPPRRCAACGRLRESRRRCAHCG